MAGSSRRLATTTSKVRSEPSLWRKRTRPFSDTPGRDASAASRARSSGWTRSLMLPAERASGVAAQEARRPTGVTKVDGQVGVGDDDEVGEVLHDRPEVLLAAVAGPLGLGGDGEGAGPAPGQDQDERADQDAQGDAGAEQEAGLAPATAGEAVDVGDGDDAADRPRWRTGARVRASAVTPSRSTRRRRAWRRRRAASRRRRARRPARGRRAAAWAASSSPDSRATTQLPPAGGGDHGEARSGRGRGGPRGPRRAAGRAAA